MVTNAFQIGDQIVVENEGLEGTVADIQTRATTILTYDDRLIVIPNATLFASAITINTASDRFRKAAQQCHSNQKRGGTPDKKDTECT